ncbi:hypothetical protein K438DRAFT_1770361 [Mycena galopus ATCC 62051]|nr:hypothetical protein K438DRAFT_1770361 [Mycena galopus ATCC 62051]
MGTLRFCCMSCFQFVLAPTAHRRAPAPCASEVSRQPRRHEKVQNRAAQRQAPRLPPHAHAHVWTESTRPPRTPPSSSVPPYAWSSSKGLDHTRVDGMWGARVPSPPHKSPSGMPARVRCRAMRCISGAALVHAPRFRNVPSASRGCTGEHTSDDVTVQGEDQGTQCKRPAFRSESLKSNTSAQREGKSRRERRGKSSGKAKIGEQENRIEGGGKKLIKRLTGAIRANPPPLPAHPATSARRCRRARPTSG